jgi:hypothetical protein
MRASNSTTVPLQRQSVYGPRNVSVGTAKTLCASCTTTTSTAVSGDRQVQALYAQYQPRMGQRRLHRVSKTFWARPTSLVGGSVLRGIPRKHLQVQLAFRDMGQYWLGSLTYIVFQLKDRRAGVSRKPFEYARRTLRCWKILAWKISAYAVYLPFTCSTLVLRCWRILAWKDLYMPSFVGA